MDGTQYSELMIRVAWAPIPRFLMLIILIAMSVYQLLPYLSDPKCCSIYEYEAFVQNTLDHHGGKDQQACSHVEIRLERCGLRHHPWLPSSSSPCSSSLHLQTPKCAAPRWNSSMHQRYGLYINPQDFKNKNIRLYSPNPVSRNLLLMLPCLGLNLV